MFKIKIMIGRQIGYLPTVYDSRVFDLVDRLNLQAALVGSLSVYFVEYLHRSI